MEKIVLLIAMFTTLVGVLSLYGSRNIVNKKIKNVKDKNKAVYIVKILSVLLTIVSLTVVYFLNR